MNGYMPKAEDCLLLCVDIQQKLYAAMQQGFKEIFLKNSAIMLEVAKTFNMPIIVSEQYPRGLGKTVDELEDVIQGLPRFEKLHFSCFKDQSLRTQMERKARKTVVVIGIEAHVCVYQSVLDLLGAGYRTVVISDAVCSRREQDRTTALKALENAGAIICTTEMLAFMFIEKAGTPQFNKLSVLFR